MQEVGCMFVRLPFLFDLGYTSPNAKLENDLHIVQQHMLKMQSLIVKRNRRGNIPENKQRVESSSRIDYRSWMMRTTS